MTYAANSGVDSVFAGLVGPALLVTGKSVVIVDAGPDDFDRVREFYEELGDASTYFRFFGIRKHLPDAELQAVVSHDVPKHVTLLAQLDGRLIGIGEFIVGADPTEAEVAFSVADDHHHEGVGTLLLERLAVVGRRCGLERLIARTMSDNRAMLLVFRTAGLAVHTDSDGGEVRVILDLTGLEELDRQAALRHAIAAAAASGGTER